MLVCWLGCALVRVQVRMFDLRFVVDVFGVFVCCVVGLSVSVLISSFVGVFVCCFDCCVLVVCLSVG